MEYPGKGPGPLFLNQTAAEGSKTTFGDRPSPLSKGLDGRSAPSSRPLSRGLDLASCTIQFLVWHVIMLTVTLFSFANVLVNLSLPKFLQLSQALRVFSLHARGPAFEHYAAQFQDECNKVTYYLDRNLFLWRPPFWSKLWQYNCKVAMAAQWWEHSPSANVVLVWTLWHVSTSS